MRFTELQMVGILREADATPVEFMQRVSTTNSDRAIFCRTRVRRMPVGQYR